MPSAVPEMWNVLISVEVMTLGGDLERVFVKHKKGAQSQIIHAWTEVKKLLWCRFSIAFFGHSKYRFENVKADNDNAFLSNGQDGCFHECD